MSIIYVRLSLKTLKQIAMKSYSLVLLAIESLVILGGYFSWKDGYLTMSQAKRLPHAPGKVIAVWIEHIGMWGDFFIVSPVIAYILLSFYSSWSVSDIISSLAVGVALGMMMCIAWSKGSKRMDESMARNGVLTPAGFVHALYMSIALAVLMLFYFFTPANVTSPIVVNLISIGIIIHLVFALIMPELHTFKRISAGAAISTAIAVGFVVWRWEHLLSSSS